MITKYKHTTLSIIKSFIILALFAGLTGCRELSNFFDPAKNASNRPLKTVKRDKPNLADDSAAREVDPDSDDLVEATDEEVANDIAAMPPSNDAIIPTNTNTNGPEPTAELAAIEEKARKLAGRWEPANNPDGVIFEFTAYKKEGDTFVGTFNFYSNGDRDLPFKYVVSADEMIKLIQDSRQSKIKCEISNDGNSMRFTNQDGEVSDLRRTNAQPKKQQERPRATPPKIEIPQ